MPRRFIIFFSFLLIGSHSVFSQPHTDFFQRFVSEPAFRMRISRDSIKLISEIFESKGERNPQSINTVRAQILSAFVLSGNGKLDSASALLKKAEKYFVENTDKYNAPENGIILLHQAGLYSSMMSLSLAEAYGNQARSIFSANKDRLNEIAALNTIGNAQLLRENYAGALQNYLASQQLMRELPDIKARYDPGLELNIANVYIWMGQFKNALRTSLKAVKTLEQRKAKVGHSTAYLILGSAYSKLSKPDSALYFYKQALRLSELYNYSDGVSIALYKIAVVYREEEQFEKSNEALHKALALHSDPNSDLQLTILLARNLMNLKMYDSASATIHAIMKSMPDEMYTIEALELNEVLADLFRHENKKDSLIKYLDRISALKNEIYSIENQRKISSIYAEMETLSSQQQIKFLEQQKQIDLADKQRLRLTLLFGMITAVFAVVLIILQYRARQKQQQIKTLQLEDQLTQQKGELHAQTLKMIYINNTISEVEERLKKLKTESKENPKDIQQMLNAIQINRGIEHEWENFERYFNNVHTEFFDRLTTAYPNLTITEKRLSSLVKMNLTNSEIAGLMKIETSSVKTAKYRLKKKIGGTEEQDLYDILLQFDSTSPAMTKTKH